MRNETQTFTIAGSGTPFIPLTSFHPSDIGIAYLEPTSYEVRWFDFSTGSVSPLYSPSGEVSSLHFDQSGSHLLAIGEQVVVTDWNKRSTREVSKTTGHDFVEPDKTWVNEEGVWIFSGGRGVLLDPSGRLIRETPLAHDGQILGVARNLPEATFVIVQSFSRTDRSVSAINLHDGQVRHSFEGLSRIVLSPDASVMVAQLQGCEDAMIWSTRSGELLGELPNTELHSSSVICGDNKHMITPGNNSGTLFVFDLGDASRRIIDTGDQMIPSLKTNHSSPIFATIANDERYPVDSTMFWLPTESKPLGSTCGHACLSDKSFSPSGKYFLTATNDVGEEHTVGTRTGGTISISEVPGSKCLRSAMLR